MATTAQKDVLKPLYRSLYQDLGIARGPQTPKGVAARKVDGRTLYVNTTAAPVDVQIEKPGRGLLSGKPVSGNLRLEAYGVELLEHGER